MTAGSAPYPLDAHRLELLIDTISDYAIYMLDGEGFITSWNTAAEKINGYSSVEIVGQHFSRFFTPEDQASQTPEKILKAARAEGRHETEGWRVRKDGSRFWASAVVDVIRDKNGGAEGFVKVTRDVTERHAAQKALRESERQFRLLVAGVTDYALYMLDPNGIVTSWNAGAQRIKGYNAEEIIGQHFSRFYTEGDRAAGIPVRALYIATHEGRFEAEGWRVRKDGTLFWANVIIDPIHDEQNKLIGFAKITRDITERRETQNALQEAQMQRAHAQKMDALGQLTGGVAHDFNNLLMVVSAHIETIKIGVADNPKMARAAEAIELAAHRGETLTRQLLTFSRRQAFNPQVVMLAERIDALRSMLTSSIGAAVRLITAIDAEVWPVKVDVSELELAMINVALNARDAMPRGGLISITAENTQLSRNDTKDDITGDFVALRIVDTGSGIAPDVLPRVFDPFFTTKEVNKGSGLGLSQVYGFARQSGGTVMISSEIGRGTTVTLYLPRSHEAEKKPVTEPEVEGIAAGAVLVVEDNPDVAGVTVAMLEQLGYSVRAVGNADAALEAIARERFDLVVSDIVMAGTMDGIKLARVISEREQKIPVLLVTGYSRAAGEAAREFTLLRKPFQLSELSRIVGRLIAESKRLAVPAIKQLRDIKT